MLVAKLKSPLQMSVQISPVKTETREVDSFYAIPLGYVLGEEKVDLHVFFTKEHDVLKNPSSDVKGEGEMIKEYSQQKVFNLTLSSEETIDWGNDDKSLLQIIARKYGIEIESFSQIN